MYNKYSIGEEQSLQCKAHGCQDIAKCLATLLVIMYAPTSPLSIYMHSPFLQTSAYDLQKPYSVLTTARVRSTRNFLNKHPQSLKCGVETIPHRVHRADQYNSQFIRSQNIRSHSLCMLVCTCVPDQQLYLPNTASNVGFLCRPCRRALHREG